MSNNSKAFDALNEQIRKLNQLSNGFPEKVAPLVGAAGKEELKKQASAQEGPTGKAWEPSEEGKDVLVNSGNKVRVTVEGTSVTFSIRSPEARHNIGAVKGGKKREILPNARIPQKMTKAITNVVTGEFQAVMNGKK